MPDITPEGSFGAIRKYDRHTGIDLHCDEGTEVFAIENGTIFRISQFTGEAVGSPWWHDTNYIGVIGQSGYIVYGEIQPHLSLQPGDEVKAGQSIGKVMRVLKQDKGKPTSMLHLELYSIPLMEPEEWKLNALRSRWLQDPTTLLNERRFDHDASNQFEAARYMSGRSLQMAIDHWYQGGGVMPPPETHEWGIVQYFRCAKEANSGQIAMSIFMYPQFRGKGIYQQVQKERGYPIITMDDCKIVPYLSKNNIPYIVVGRHTQWEEYKLISNFYGDRKAKRSGVFLMNHIDEGLRSGNSEKAMRAFCIHPIIQADEDLKTNIALLRHIDGEIVALAMEYRRVANAYLSNRQIEYINDIELSPVPEVNEMLKMDKLQNKKDFDLYHKGKHPRSAELEEYFNNWFVRLGFSNVVGPQKGYR